MRSLLLPSLLFLHSLLPAHAQEVRVVKAGGTKTSLDCSAFTASGGASGIFLKTLQNDLTRCGWFALTRPSSYSVTGSCRDTGGGLSVQCQVMNLVKTEVAMNKNYTDQAANARRLAHKVADDIIMAIKGFRGICSGRIVMVGNRTGSKELYVCDADGGGLRQLTHDRSISLAPQWFPDGNRIAYTSFIKGFADAYVVDLRSGARTAIARYPGLNMAGGVSPGGGEVLLVLSRDGNPEIYAKSLGGGQLTRLTRTPRAGEASPTWSPDGSQIAYVSDITGAGSPQLHVMDRGGNSRPLTTRGRSRENVAPDWGPNNWIAYCSKRGGLYGIYIINPATMEERAVSPQDTHYEDPAWASDGRHIVCSRREGRGNSIYLLDTMGDPPVCLTPNGGSWFSPAWCAQ